MENYKLRSSTPMEVALGVIVDRQKNVLLTKRAHTASHGGFWEFPGGKLECGETAEQAIIREIREEVGLDAQSAFRVGIVNHRYPDKEVMLHVYYIDKYLGEPTCCETQLDIRWFPLEAISQLQFPEANISVIQLVSSFLKIGRCLNQ